MKRRTLAVMAMFGGALIGTGLVLNGKAALVLLLALGIAAATAVGMTISRGPSATDFGG
jgi:hypothetical protein